VKKENNEIETLDLETYLIGVLAAEMPASFEKEALKAQAVASRTYAMYKIEHNTNNDYDVLASITNQSYITEDEMKDLWNDDYQKYYEKISEAVNETSNEVMYYNDEIIEAFYFSMSNGQTENSIDVFNEELPYIKSVSSKWDNEELNNFLSTIEIEKSTFCEKLNLRTCDTLKITNITKTSSNRISSLTINNQEFKGTKIRELLNLRSTDFSIDIKDNKVTIITKGYGHGVGMSQYGANGMAKDGYSYQQILKYYYNDININKMV
jgi:stage II sporulation protein D